MIFKRKYTKRGNFLTENEIAVCLSLHLSEFYQLSFASLFLQTTLKVNTKVSFTKEGNFGTGNEIVLSFSVHSPE